MKADYKNWMPKGMVCGILAAAVIATAAALFFGWAPFLTGPAKTVIVIVLSAAAVLFWIATIWTAVMYRAFDYHGSCQLSRRVIEGVASRVAVPDGGRCLDVGCGSGALAIAVAKRNPNAEITGIDRWGKEYASFSLELCEKNARAEGVSNVLFRRGNAVKLDFPDETFDAVTSNYVYHNIPGDRQSIFLETLRTLKKGGTFAIHDAFVPVKYGDMQAFLQKLRDMGYQKAELIDTTDGLFMTRSEARRTSLSGSALLLGVK